MTSQTGIAGRHHPRTLRLGAESVHVQRRSGVVGTRHIPVLSEEVRVGAVDPAAGIGEDPVPL